jgi:hypothetical protein
VRNPKPSYSSKPVSQVEHEAERESSLMNLLIRDIAASNLGMIRHTTEALSERSDYIAEHADTIDVRHEYRPASGKTYPSLCSLNGTRRPGCARLSGCYCARNYRIRP